VEESYSTFNYRPFCGELRYYSNAKTEIEKYSKMIIQQQAANDYEDPGDNDPTTIDITLFAENIDTIVQEIINKLSIACQLIKIDVKLSLFK
jgi:hypothetical protein